MMNDHKQGLAERAVFASMRGALAVFAVALSAPSCAPDSTSEAGLDRATDNFIVQWNPSSCTIANVRKPVLRVCVRGSGDIAHGQIMTRRGLEAWLVPLRARYENIATDIEFACNNPDLTVNVYPGDQRAFSSPSYVQGVYDRNPLGTWIHEFGHAFTCLGDTYQGGTAAWCIPGQPRSIMCYGLLLNDITEDDINGMVQQANRLGFTRRTPGSDGGTPVPPDASVPGGGDSGTRPPDPPAPPSDPCASNNTCGACTPVAGCGWCGASNTCISVDSSGAPTAACSGGFALNPPDCPSSGGTTPSACASNTTCGACTPVAGCGWCGASNTCIPVDRSGAPTAACSGGFALNPPDCASGSTPPSTEPCGRYAGWNVWSCIDNRTRVRCVSGALQRETCASQCVARPVGVDDLCR